eukprot:631896-Amphidinium_carterae.1
MSYGLHVCLFCSFAAYVLRGPTSTRAIDRLDLVWTERLTLEPKLSSVTRVPVPNVALAVLLSFLLYWVFGENHAGISCMSNMEHRLNFYFEDDHE